MDPTMMATVPPFYYDPTVSYSSYPMTYGMPMYPATPTTSGMQPIFPDSTSFKSGSELGDTPSSSGSSSTQPTKKKFKSPEEEKRYRMKRARNNEAAKKSRKSRKEKEVTLQEQVARLNSQLSQKDQIIAAKDHDIAHLKAMLASCHPAINNENFNPSFGDSKAFQGRVQY